MKPRQQLSWMALGLTLFLGLSILLNLAPAQSADPTVQTEQQKDCSQILIEADDLYQGGNQEGATQLYRQCKVDFPNASATPTIIPEPVYNIEELGGGDGLWKNALEGMENNQQKSKVYFSLVPLTQLYPQFIPAHIKLTEFCLNDPNFCANNAKEGQPKTASQAIERITELYPDDPDLLRTKIKVLDQEEKFLEASIAARQFSIVYDDYPEAPEFARLADEYLNKFEDNVQGELVGKTTFGTLINIGSAILNNNPTQGLSGLKMISLLVQGESGFGSQAISSFTNEQKQRGTLVEDPEIIDYIKGIAGRMTPYMGREFKYEYYVVQDSSINAFALPGGKVVVNTGAILNADSEAELAGLLGHEISHAVLSHGFLKLVQGNLLENLDQVVPLFDQVSPVLNAQYSQDAERQADLLGTRALASAGYAADGLRDFMMIIKETSENQPTNYLSTHPAPSERVQYLEKLIVDNGYNRYAYLGVKRHQQIKERLQMLR
ncbi:M48 family metallopeptidase [Crocosphaera sp. UHCC 0190]|uniref:M48 family metallopeptidase n=1 Tax=Crocosphaera sp. UHCC 0190 TaxID=3110246 RepID=UPI002B219886|nr:M48 family metallopeptidase [Crocosphaera sp. UHCC 0190]MEA5511587.1 M48 family metallopeptidase [Crocosphaera sp. UHCC 0190]